MFWSIVLALLVLWCVLAALAALPGHISDQRRRAAFEKQDRERRRRENAEWVARQDERYRLAEERSRIFRERSQQ